jgi:hypothetical protein
MASEIVIYKKATGRNAFHRPIRASLGPRARGGTRGCGGGESDDVCFGIRVEYRDEVSLIGDTRNLCYFLVLLYGYIYELV